MIASNICKDLIQDILNDKVRGEVHSVYKNSFNIITLDQKIVTILAPNKSMSPNSLKIIDEICFLYLDIKQGDMVIFYKTHMSIVNKEVNIYYNEAIEWDNCPNFTFIKEKKEILDEKLFLIGQYLQQSGSRDGIYPLLNTLEEIENIEIVLNKGYILSKSELFIYKRFIDFIKAFKDNKIDVISQLTNKIIGFGAGLTPSMDDFICGIMISNIYLSYFLDLDINQAYNINTEIVKNIDNKTTKISEEMLKLSSKGKVSEDIRQLLVCLLSNEDKINIKDKISKVADFGHSSGTDILCGIYIGAKSLLNNIYKGLILDFRWSTTGIDA